MIKFLFSGATTLNFVMCFLSLRLKIRMCLRCKLVASTGFLQCVKRSYLVAQCLCKIGFCSSAERVSPTESN